MGRDLVLECFQFSVLALLFFPQKLVDQFLNPEEHLIKIGCQDTDLVF